MSEPLRGTKEKSFWNVIRDVMPFITVIVAFVGGVVTGEFRSRSDVQLQNQRYLLEVRKETYTNYFEGQAGVQHAENLEAIGLKEEAEKVRHEYELRVKTSRFQIAVFSTKPVVKALASYFRIYFNLGPCFGNRQKWIDDVKTYQNMRQEVFGDEIKQRVDNNDLSVLLFLCKLNEELSK